MTMSVTYITLTHVYLDPTQFPYRCGSTSLVFLYFLAQACSMCGQLETFIWSYNLVVGMATNNKTPLCQNITHEFCLYGSMVCFSFSSRNTNISPLYPPWLTGEQHQLSICGLYHTCQDMEETNLHCFPQVLFTQVPRFFWMHCLRSFFIQVVFEILHKAEATVKRHCFETLCFFSMLNVRGWRRCICF